MASSKARPHQARKRFGQNFLTDSNIIAKIIAAINPASNQRVIEIGPGKGALTNDLIASQCDLSVIEIDRDLIKILSETYHGLHIIEHDALKFDFSNIANIQHPLKVVGNLPYNISTPLIFHLLSYSNLIGDMFFMLQKEVVDRMAAQKNNKTYGRLTIMTQYHCDVTPLFDIPPTAFYPQPKVTSTLVHLRPRPFHCQTSDSATLNQLVSAAFNQRRKTLRKSLGAFPLDGISPELLSLRAEDLSVEDFVKLGNQIASSRNQAENQ